MNITDANPAITRDGIADYRFIRKLGTGNHGVFYLARRPQRLPVSAEVVAVKVLSGTSGQDTFRRAVRELAAFATGGRRASAWVAFTLSQDVVH